jgi:hypothetical protein
VGSDLDRDDGITQLLGTDDTTVRTATLISMISIALGMETGMLAWRAFGTRPSR